MRIAACQVKVNPTLFPFSPAGYLQPQAVGPIRPEMSQTDAPFPEGAGDEDDDLIRTANDHFFQGYYGIEDASRGFLQPTILSELSESLDWEGAPMELVRGLFVDPRLRFKSSDLLWKVMTKSGDETYVLLSFDHQTRPDKWMALRCLVMQGLALLKILGEDEGKPKSDLPVIYCVVLYQGLEPWSAPLEFQELVNLAAFPEESREKIRDYVPKLRYQFGPAANHPGREIAGSHLDPAGIEADAGGDFAHCGRLGARKWGGIGPVVATGG